MKSAYDLGIWGNRFFNKFNHFLVRMWFEKRHLFSDIEQTPIDKYYHDFHGWEKILWQTSGDIPVLWMCANLCWKHDIKHKSAAYQVKGICDIYEIDENKSIEQINEIVSLQ